jgi:hypothetical protein
MMIGRTRLQKRREDQTADDRDVGHREGVAGDERLCFQNTVEARRMGGAKRYPSISARDVMGFAKSSTHPTG